MYNHDKVHKMFGEVNEIIEKSKKLDRRSVKNVLLCHHVFVDDPLPEPHKMVMQALNMNKIVAAYWLNVVFGLGVATDLKPDELKQTMAESFEVFADQSRECLNWLQRFLNENKASSALKSTWAFKALETLEPHIDNVLAWLVKGDCWKHGSIYEYVTSAMNALWNIRAALEAAQ